MRNTIVLGDAVEILRTMPDDSVHCVVTSPPYYRLRDYGVDGQIGLENSLAEYLNRLRDVFREVRRVLRSDGTCWVNMGDIYTGGGAGADMGKHTSNKGSLHGIRTNDLPAITC